MFRNNQMVSDFLNSYYFFVTILLINFMYTLNNVIEIVLITSNLRICERTVKKLFILE